MKKAALLIVIILTVLSCKTENNDPIYEGEFIYIADGAVLKGTDFIYGVTLDDKAAALAEEVNPVKENDFDMVPVTIKGKLGENPLFTETGEGWPEILTITEIVSVGTTPAKADVKIEEKK
ncbi:hypothetical protein [Cochleicola gelatinilyticus]|uniref:NlpE C-terminal OB domain-containing protein n=1 Tax=Cochleicola gelatinilyticus TaxID=1763537 RepID=A0A167IW75_9FLAO|nr:hypothetical protein [Cochleicola gelatinilyticus]OAB80078.1 hypothetical protein ULVI_04885 [Cochleicola gelatinilyticus]